MKNMRKIRRGLRRCQPEYVFVTALLLAFFLAGAGYLIFAPKQDFGG